MNTFIRTIAVIVVLAAATASPFGSAAEVACVVPVNGAQVTEASRRKCVENARSIEAEPPTDPTEEMVRLGPPSKDPIRPDEIVYCRLKLHPKSEASLKFRCLRTDAEGRLLHKDGTPEKIDELRVKYFTGQFPAPRMREPFTESAGSRLFWLLGFPVDSIYRPSAIRCFGCGPDPFNEQRVFDYAKYTEFRNASIKRKYEGKTIETSDGQGIGFTEVLGIQTRSKRLQDEFDAYLLALHWIGVENVPPFQNRLLCRQDGWDEAGACADPVAYMSDIGNSFGNSFGKFDARVRTGNPRGDLIAFRTIPVFRDSVRCEIRLNPSRPVYREVSEVGRRLFLERADQLTRELIHIALESSGFDSRMDPIANATVAAENGVSRQDPALNAHVTRAWVAELLKRRDEIARVRCRN